MGIGAKIKLILNDGREIYRTMSSGSSFGGSPSRLEIGLGQQDLDQVEISWPSGINQIFTSLKSGNAYLIIEDQDEPTQIMLTEFELQKRIGHHHGHH